MGFDINVKDLLDDHGTRICKLETDVVTMKEKLNNIEHSVQRFETAYYQNTNSLFQTISQLVVNTSNSSNELAKSATNNIAEITKDDNKNTTSIILKTLGVISACALSALGALYGVK